MNKKIINFVQDVYQTKDFIPLHAPIFIGKEKKYVNDALDSTYVSSIGKYVDDFEKRIKEYTNTSKAVVTVNGTAALHTALYMAGVKSGDLVITQSLTFVATCNVIHHMNAEPVFVDVSSLSLGLCPNALESYLEEYALINSDGACEHKITHQIIRAVVPMHTFGHPVDLDEISIICSKWNIMLIEDAAESLGSFYKDNHTGTVGSYGALSFNGNKIITTGGGGAILTKTFKDYKRVKHILTTAKIAHPYNYVHDEVGFNYRMPNINASLGLAQIEDFSEVLSKKKRLALMYKNFFKDTRIDFFEPINTNKQNNWLNTIIFSSKYERNLFMRVLIENDIFPRPPWKLMSKINFFKECFSDDLSNSRYLEERILNIPSSTIK